MTEEARDGMRTRWLLIVVVLGFGVVSCGAELNPAPFSIGFAVGAPWRLPVDWTGSFSLLTAEALLSHNLTVGFELGTYPASFPDLVEGSASLLVKGWLGTAALFAGGGLTARWNPTSTAWIPVPHLNLKAGVQLWWVDALAWTVQLRSVEPLPARWMFSPEISVGASVALGRGRPDSPFVDGPTLWILVGLGVAALIAFLPRM